MTQPVYIRLEQLERDVNQLRNQIAALPGGWYKSLLPCLTQHSQNLHNQVQALRAELVTPTSQLLQEFADAIKSACLEIAAIQTALASLNCRVSLLESSPPTGSAP